MKIEVALQMKRLVLQHADSLNMDSYAKQVPVTPYAGCRTVCCMAGHLAFTRVAGRSFFNEAARIHYINCNAHEIARRALELTEAQAELLFTFHRLLTRAKYWESLDLELRAATVYFTEIFARLVEHEPYSVEYAQVVASAIDLAIKLWGTPASVEPEPEAALEPVAV